MGEKEHPESKKLEDARQYVKDYLQKRTEEGKSPWTIWRDGAALGKVYSCSGSHDFGFKMPERHSADVTRSRGENTNHFNEEENKNLVEFAAATGLRHYKELAQVTVNHIAFNSKGEAYIKHIQGKGGRFRDVPVFKQEPILEALRNAQAEGRKLLFPDVKKHFDCHAYRAEYAKDMYLLYAGDVSKLPKEKLYICRGTRKGLVFDRVALKKVSGWLGHSREGVIVLYYLSKLFK